MKIRSIFMNLLLSGCLSVGLWFPQGLNWAVFPRTPEALPVAVDDSYTTSENLLLTISAPGVLQNDISNPPSTLTASLVKGTSNGALTLSPNGSFTYNPSINFSGTDDFTYTATDSGGTSNTAKVTLTITPVNHPPSAVDDQVSTLEDTAITIDVLANDTDPDGVGDLVPSSVTVVSQPGNGQTQVNLTTGAITYTPKPNYFGTDVFRYQICDKGVPALCNSAKVTVSVTPVNDPPVATADTYFVNQDTTLTVGAPGVLENDNDVDGSYIAAELDQGPSHGTLDYFNSDGSFSYSPQAGFAGQDTFTYHAFDGSLTSNSVTVTITVYDTEPPKIVQWLQPQVDINRIYYVDGPTVTLEVTATDNVAVAQVCFSRWDPVYNKYVNIASLQVAPYLWQLDTSALVLGFNQVYARAFDPSGNDSGQDNFIWLVVPRRLYLPVLIR